MKNRKRNEKSQEEDAHSTFQINLIKNAKGEWKRVIMSKHKRLRAISVFFRQTLWRDFYCAVISSSSSLYALCAVLHKARNRFSLFYASFYGPIASRRRVSHTREWVREQQKKHRVICYYIMMTIINISVEYKLSTPSIHRRHRFDLFSSLSLSCLLSHNAFSIPSFSIESFLPPLALGTASMKAHIMII